MRGPCELCDLKARLNGEGKPGMAAMLPRCEKHEKTIPELYAEIDRLKTELSKAKGDRDPKEAP